MLHVVTCLFNPCGYRRLAENHRRFAAGMAAAGVPLTTVELSYDGTFAVPGSLRLRGNPAEHALWQKERLLNVGIDSLPAEVDKVAWVDADLLFLNPDWAAQAERLLDEIAVCQLFERCRTTDAAGRVDGCGEGWAKVFNSGRVPEDKYQPGFAWACRRDLLAGGPADSGLYDRDVVGGGDRSMAFAWAGMPRFNERQREDAAWVADYLAWAGPQAARTGGKIGVVPGDLVHLYHGSAKNRRYRERIAYLVDHDYDPAADLALDDRPGDDGGPGSAGLWRWKNDPGGAVRKPGMRRAVRNYFELRNDDGADRPVTSWSVGVVTAPRKTPTLGDTLESLGAAGFWDVRLFAEPGTPIPAAHAHRPASSRGAARSEALGAFPNWYLALSELVLRDPAADAYLLCEDDVAFSRGLRGYLGKTLWPAADVGAVSLHTPSHFAAGEPPGWHAEDRGWRTWGAQALAFPNASARALLTDPAVLDHRGFGPHGGSRDADCVVGAWCRRAGRSYWVHRPSLARHTGETSTLWPPDRRCAGRRQCADFLEVAPA